MLKQKSILDKIKQRIKIKKYLSMRDNRYKIHSTKCPPEYKIKKNGIVFYINWSKELPIWICKVKDFLIENNVLKFELEILNEKCTFSDKITILKDLDDINLFTSYVDACKFIYKHTGKLVDKDFYNGK
jgi:hypothetical protein